MEAFKVKLWERLESPPQQPFGGVGTIGFHAPARVVLVLQQGTGWALRDDGTRHILEAKSVVIYEAGEWVEYGGDGTGEPFSAELYFAENFSQEQAEAMFARFAHAAG